MIKISFNPALPGGIGSSSLTAHTHRAHVGLDQLKSGQAIERRRTAALGGRITRCEDEACGYTTIADKTCRDRHCAKC